MAFLEVKGISKYYGSQAAVDNLSFKADKGEIIGFIGPNGAGKSTTMKIITGFYDEFEGAVEVEGCSAENLMDRKSKIGYLPESNPLYKEMFIKEYLHFIGKTTHTGNLKKRIAEVIELTGLKKEQHKKIKQLSKGYKQRVGIAQAILHDPDILILDEPISGLDPNQLVEIRKLIKELSKDKCVIFSSHILQEIEAICSRIIIINNGKLVADDPINTLLSKNQKVYFEIGFEKPMDIKFLRKIEAISNVIFENDYYLIESSLDVRRQLFELAVKEDNSIMHLLLKEIEIVDIFKKMTNE